MIAQEIPVTAGTKPVSVERVAGVSSVPDDQLYSSRDQFFSFETGGFFEYSEEEDDEDDFPLVGRQTAKASAFDSDSDHRRSNPFDIERMVYQSRETLIKNLTKKLWLRY